MHTAPAGHARVRHPAVDLIGWVVRIFAAGLAVSLALAGVVLLLASSAEAAESAPHALRAGEAGQGTLLFGAGESTWSAPTLHTDVLIRVSGPLARTRVEQRFRNPGEDWQEGIYVFPLPDNAAVDRLRLRIGERVVDGEIRERGEARASYDKARAAGQRGALLEQQRPNLFTTSVANIGPGEEVVVEIEYQQTLAYTLADGVGRYSLRFPMVVGPRYIPGAPLGGRGHGGSPDTDQVADASRITPPVVHPDAGAINPVSLRVELDAGVPIARVDSTHHAVRVERTGDDTRVVELDAGTTPANRDFELDWTLAAGRAPQVALFAEQGRTLDYALLMLVPPAPGTPAQALPREVIFVIDTSGSMEGASIVQAREALALALQRLAPADRFNVIEFNSTATALFDTAQAATPATVAAAVARVRALRANGGTEMAAALELALGGSADPARVRQVVFLTDGAVGNEEHLFGLIQKRLGDSRLFTIGIGSAPNSHFMRKAAQAGRGSFTYIGKIDEVKDKMTALLAKLESPVLKGIEVSWPDGADADAWPQRIPDLYAGEPIVVAAALHGTGGRVRVTGHSGNARWSTEIPLDRAADAAGIGTLWARQKTEALLDSIRDGAAEAEVRPAIVALALEHRLVGKYTSLVAVDNTPGRPADTRMATTAMPTNLPDGWNAEAVFGELPSGATDARWHLRLGVLALLICALLWSWQRGSTTPSRSC